MPFVIESHRKYPDPVIAGDRCYVNYVEIMKEWRDSPLWTTVDTMMQQLLAFLGGAASVENKAASLLAFMVFFNLHVMPYELKKREENGDI